MRRRGWSALADKGFPILPQYEVFYIHSMLFNTTSAVKSLEHLSGVFDKTSAHNAESKLKNLDHDDILNNFQNVILQGAAISRYFWPARTGHSARSELLRNACNVDDSSQLKNRDLRNAIEHFDDKLDEYLADGLVGYVFPQYVGPQQNNNGVPGHVFRAYYVDVGLFELLGKRYDIEPLAKEIERVHRRLEYCLENGGRLWPAGHP